MTTLKLLIRRCPSIPTTAATTTTTTTTTAAATATTTTTTTKSTKTNISETPKWNLR
jgi:hypothetical protein